MVPQFDAPECLVIGNPGWPVRGHRAKFGRVEGGVEDQHGQAGLQLINHPLRYGYVVGRPTKRHSYKSVNHRYPALLELARETLIVCSQTMQRARSIGAYALIPDKGESD